MGSSGNNNNNNNNTVKAVQQIQRLNKKIKIRVDTNVPVPGDTKKDIKNKFESILMKNSFK